MENTPEDGAGTNRQIRKRPGRPKKRSDKEDLDRVTFDQVDLFDHEAMVDKAKAPRGQEPGTNSRQAAKDLKLKMPRFKGKQGSDPKVHIQTFERWVTNLVLTKKNVKYVWTEKRQQAFDTLKQKVISQPVLALSDLSKPFEVQCDACGDCLGAVLLQEGHAITYESRRLSSDEQMLGIYEKELLAILHALDSWKHYLLWTPFILRTDHQSLKYFMTQTKLSDKQMRWANFLSRFNFDIAHIAGKHNQVADALSRRPKVNAVSIATHNDLSSMIDDYAIDPDFKDVVSTIALGKKEEPFTLQDGYLLPGNRLCITRSLREKVMFESHAPSYAEHRGIQTTMKAIEEYFYWLTMKGDPQDYVSKCVVYQKTKYDRGKQPGLLQPLPIPDSPWESISMDFIFGLPKSIHGNTGIWTIVDRVELRGSCREQVSAISWMGYCNSPDYVISGEQGLANIDKGPPKDDRIMKGHWFDIDMQRFLDACQNVIRLELLVVLRWHTRLKASPGFCLLFGPLVCCSKGEVLCSLRALVRVGAPIDGVAVGQSTKGPSLLFGIVGAKGSPATGQGIGFWSGVGEAVFALGMSIVEVRCRLTWGAGDLPMSLGATASARAASFSRC
ncbi:hypothetical protein L7F22_054086 [Adiantum nelumboides]|nr:hypothetical protein [Adiantum nelumboides]